MVAASPAERRLIAAHTSALGVQLLADAWYAVGVYTSLVEARHSGSIPPTGIGFPGARTQIRAEPLPKATLINQVSARSVGSCQRNVGGTISGGKIDSLCG